MITASLLALSVLCAAPVHDVRTNDDAVAEDNVLVRYDLRPVMAEFDGPSWREPLVSVLAAPEELSYASADELAAAAAPETIVDVVTRILGDEMHFEGREMSLVGTHSLLVLAPASVHAKIRAVLDGLEGAMSAELRVRMDVYSLAGPATVASNANIVSLAEADRIGAELASAGAEHTSEDFELYAGRTALLDETRATTFVYDYSVEIAQGSLGFDPVIVNVPEGRRTMLRGFSTGAGAVLSFLTSDTRLEGGLRSRAFGGSGAVGHVRDGGLEFVAGPQSIQTADASTTSVACTTFVPQGKAAVFTSDATRAGAVSHQVIVLRVVGDAPASFRSIDIPDSNFKLMLLNSEVFAASQMNLATYRESIDGHYGHPIVSASHDPSNSQFLFDWLKPRFSVWRRFGPWAVVVTTPAWDNQASDQLAALVASLDASRTTVDVTFDLVASDGSKPARWSLPVLTGSTFGAVAGTTSTAMVDYDIEVAQFATISDALVIPIFDGLAGSIGVSESGGGFVVDMEGYGYRIQRPIQPLESSGPFTGHVDQVVTDRIAFDERQRVGRGAAATIGSNRGMRVVVGLR